jgi:hypothetical protein
VTPKSDSLVARCNNRGSPLCFSILASISPAFRSARSFIAAAQLIKGTGNG